MGKNWNKYNYSNIDSLQKMYHSLKLEWGLFPVMCLLLFSVLQQFPSGSKWEMRLNCIECTPRLESVMKRGRGWLAPEIHSSAIYIHVNVYISVDWVKFNMFSCRIKAITIALLGSNFTILVVLYLWKRMVIISLELGISL